jgi:hypothetical protein
MNEIQPDPEGYRRNSADPGSFEMRRGTSAGCTACWWKQGHFVDQRVRRVTRICRLFRRSLEVATCRGHCKSGLRLRAKMCKIARKRTVAPIKAPRFAFDQRCSFNRSPRHHQPHLHWGVRTRNQRSRVKARASTRNP